MEKKFEAKWPKIEDNAATQAAVSLDLEVNKDWLCEADMCARNCKTDRESVDMIKQSIEKLMEKCLLSEKTVATHKNKIQDMYDKLIPKNEPSDQNNDTWDDKNECSPPIREHPNTQNEHHNSTQGIQNSQSRPYDTHNGYKENKI